MNKRIKELAIEARLLTGWPVGEVEYQKFAELIVRECIRVAHAAERKPEGFLYAKGAHILETEIYNHFGVKE
jgi:hypothetical protein